MEIKELSINLNEWEDGVKAVKLSLKLGIDGQRDVIIISNPGGEDSGEINFDESISISLKDSRFLTALSYMLCEIREKIQRLVNAIIINKEE